MCIFFTRNKMTYLKVLTYNVLWQNSVEDWNNILSYVKEIEPDVIGFQEASRKFYELIKEDEYWIYNYNYIKPIFSFYDSDMLLIKRNLKPKFYTPPLLPKTKEEARRLCLATITINNCQIGIGSVHIQSLFFKPKYTTVKCEQIGFCVETLLTLEIDAFILMGDFNLTQNQTMNFRQKISNPSKSYELDSENKCIQKYKLTDVWRDIVPTSDNPKDEVFRERDVTWNSEKNYKADNGFFFRLDRIFTRDVSGNCRVIGEEVERIEEDWSDHYGLMSKLSVKRVRE